MPGQLDPTNYPDVAHMMLDDEGHQRGLRLNIMDLGPSLTEEEVLTQALAANLGVRGLHAGQRADTSFTQQMHAIVPTDPDVFLATYRSAIPVLDAVEGYYTAIGKITPPLDYIGYHSTIGGADAQQKRDRELARLAPTVRGKNVIIIDEYFGKGSTLRFAGKIASGAGAATVRGMMGTWYRKIGSCDDTRPEYNDPETIRKTHRPFMYKIGQTAAHTHILERANKPNMSASQITDGYDLHYAASLFGL